jgi:hypothetical protein
VFKTLVPLMAAAMAFVSVGCGSDTAVQLECPSPDGSLVVVLFSASGGGAAGWSYYQLALQPANLPPTPPRWSGGPSLNLMELEDADIVAVNWESNDSLSVTGMPTLSHVIEENPKLPTGGRRRVRISFNDRGPVGKADRNCFSGGREIAVRPARRLLNR